jgi:hypothetical protein
MNSKGFMGISVMVVIELLALGYYVSGGHRGDGMMSSMIDNMMRDTDLHGVVMRNGLPREYAELSNHLASTPENVHSINERWQLIKYLWQF